MEKTSGISRVQIATGIAILFHVIGLLGMLYGDKAFFISTTPLHLLLMAALVVYTHQGINLRFILFFIVCFVLGIAVEVYGTSTGNLFGKYSYGTVLGPGYKNVPYIIGVNWFIIMYCCACTVQITFNKLLLLVKEKIPLTKGKLHTFSLIIDSSFLAVIFDYFLEPAAIKLGYWQWLVDGTIPFFNYSSWFVVSAVFIALLYLLQIARTNKFAVNLLLIQLMFFLLINTLL